MKHHGFHELNRLHELLVDRVLQGLTPAEDAELKRLLAKHPHTSLETFDHAVALLDVAAACATDEPLPPELRCRLLGMNWR